MKRITLSLQAPYVGLRPFSESDAVLFFGREQHVRDLLGKLQGQQRFIAVLGASGSGKSSLVRAGVVPALHRGALASAGHSWNVCIVTPGDAPLTNLAKELVKQPGWIDSERPADGIASLSAALARSPLALTELYRQKGVASGGQALLLVVDQFEEIFRYRQKNVDEAEAFINLLLRSASEDVPIYVVMTMRSDFLGNCVAFFGLPEAINRGIYLTPRLGPDQLKSIIASPLSLVGGEIDPVLVNKLVNTLGGEDELPILEHALLRMWNRAREAARTRIALDDFMAVCARYDGPMRMVSAWQAFSGEVGLSYAIDRHAFEIYDALSSERKLMARQIFLALVERRDGREVRRPQTIKQLVEFVGEQERENLWAVIDAFRAEGVGFLLPPVSTLLDNDRMIDISHESLFRQWRLFRQWLDEEEVDVAELREWQQRTARQIEGGGWLDEYDGERADRWRERIKERGNPGVWTKRYRGPVHYREVNQYIEESLARVQRAKAEKGRLEQEAKAAETKRLELEAEVQRQAAERAKLEAQVQRETAKRVEAELVRAEKETRQAQEYAEFSRQKMRMALTCCLMAVIVVGLMLWPVPARVQVELTTERVEFEIGETSQGKTILEGFDMQSVAVEKFASLAFEPTMIEVADPMQYQVHQDDFPQSAWKRLKVNDAKVTLAAKDTTRHPRVTVETSTVGGPKTIHLDAMSVASGARVTLEAREIHGGKKEGFTFRIVGQDTVTLSIREPFRLIAVQAELRDLALPFRQQDELTYRVALPEQPSRVTVKAQSDELVLLPTFVLGQLANHVFGGIPVSVLDFSVLTGDGIITFPDYPYFGSVLLNEGEEVGLERLDKFMIESVALRPDGKGMTVVGHGLVKQIRTKRGEILIEHHVSALEALWVHARLSVLTAIISLVFTASVLAYRLRNRFKR